MTAGVDEAQKDDPQTIEAGRDLDALVAARVVGWTHITADPFKHYDIIGVRPGAQRASDGSTANHYCVPDYSTNIAWAWRVVESLRARGWFLQLHFEGPKSNQWVAYFHEDDTDDLIGADTAEYLAPTAELAICRAALDAAAQLEDQS